VQSEGREESAEDPRGQLVDAVQFGVSQMQPGMVVWVQEDRFPRGSPLRRERTLAR